jgi:hypothetical protein
MIAVAPPPTGSVITTKLEPDHTAIAWPNPGGGPVRYLVALFLLFWLGGWAWGLISVGGQILRGGLDPATLFLVFWLGAWLVGGGFALLYLGRLVRPARGARLRLHTDRLLYDPGWTPLTAMARAAARAQRPSVATMLQVPARVEVARATAGEVRLERLGERLRLTMDHGPDRVEFGDTLGEPEKEWLAGVLRQWRAS